MPQTRRFFGFNPLCLSTSSTALALACLLLSSTALAQFAGGDGSAENPWQIATPAQLDELRSYLGPDHDDKYFVLVSDIDLRGFAAGEGWAPVGDATEAFFGQLDGNGHVIRHLVIDRPGETHQGLFG